MNYTKEQLEKLPKWAQNEINRLEADLKHYKERSEQIEGSADTNTFLQEGLSSRPLPHHARIEFCLGEHNQHKASVYVTKNGYIDINCDSRMAKGTYIRPRASNAFEIHFFD